MMYMTMLCMTMIDTRFALSLSLSLQTGSAILSPVLYATPC
jgi:hypothetical protein